MMILIIVYLYIDTYLDIDLHIDDYVSANAKQSLMATILHHAWLQDRAVNSTTLDLALCVLALLALRHCIHSWNLNHISIGTCCL